MQETKMLDMNGKSLNGKFKDKLHILLLLLLLFSFQPRNLRSTTSFLAKSRDR